MPGDASTSFPPPAPEALEREHWVALARWTPLAILLDLDGTVVPFSDSPEEARPDPELVLLLSELARTSGVMLAVVSGRPREALDAFFAGHDEILLVAEHGGWRRGRGAWETHQQSEGDAIDALSEEFAKIARRYRGARVERKSWSTTFHFRPIATRERDAAAVEVDSRVEAWLAKHPQFAALRGSEVLEVRPARMDKSSAVTWLREQAGPKSRLLAMGDDITDEDMFLSLGPEDESVIVTTEMQRGTAARSRLDTTEEARAYLRWMLALRSGATESVAEVWPRAVPRRSASRGTTSSRLLVVSNRLPELRSATDSADPRARNVGGLVSALEPALSARQGVWLGWSGRTRPGADGTAFGSADTTRPALAWVDFPEDWRRDYYNGFCNAALWPLLHSFLSRVRIQDGDWTAYQEANRGFARAAVQLVGPGDTVWVHDYHLFLLGKELRELGHTGPIGLFLHVPFPGPEVFFVLPWAEQILIDLLQLDLIGFHTAAYAAAFRQCAALIPGTHVGDDVIEYRGRRTRVGVFPIGIIPEQFQQPAEAEAEEISRLVNAVRPGRLVLGVDRLDYTKGIPERLAAFLRLLELEPEWRRNVSLVQISVPSRGDVPEYMEQRDRIEHIVGRAIGELGEADWIPIRYLYRSFARSQLSLLYRSAAVGYVTPLRDGMNLVAKEYVAAQDPADPGVLVLSRFAGAAAELGGALLTNPWHVDGLARDLGRALRMELPERIERHARLLEAVSRTTAMTWAEDFLNALAQCAPA